MPMSVSSLLTGILRVEIGKERADVTGLVIDFIEKLHPQGKRPGFQDTQTAAEHLAELIDEARLLFVINDADCTRVR
jgi:hypothetical protein